MLARSCFLTRLTCFMQDIIPPQPMSTVQGIFGFLLGSRPPSNSDTVISVKHTVLAVAWLAINQSVCVCIPSRKSMGIRFTCHRHSYLPKKLKENLDPSGIGTVTISVSLQ